MGSFAVSAAKLCGGTDHHRLFQFFRNTLFITVSCLFGALFSSSIGAYSYARLEWPGRRLFFGLLLASMMLPSAVTLIPTFIGWRFADLINTYFPLILPVWLGSAFDIFCSGSFIPRYQKTWMKPHMWMGQARGPFSPGSSFLCPNRHSS